MSAFTVLLVDGPAIGQLIGVSHKQVREVVIPMLGYGEIRYFISFICVGNHQYAIGRAELPPHVCNIQYAVLESGLQPIDSEEPQVSALHPMHRPVLREDGHYYVRVLGVNALNPDGYSNKVPAVWSNKSRTWSSLRFSDVPDYMVLVEDKIQDTTRKNGWYWVQIPRWGKDEWSDWIPALWCEETRSWRLANFSGYPEDLVRVGGRLVK
jgi:hypothetical protein